MIDFSRLIRQCLPSMALGCFLFMSNVEGGAQAVRKLTLQEAQTLALQQAFSMQYAALDRTQAEREVKQVLASGLPQINLVADYSQYIDIPTQVVPADAFGFPDYLMNFLGGVAQETGVELNAPNADPNSLTELQFGQSHTANVGIQASQLVFSGSYFVGLRASQLFVEARDRAIERTADEVMRQVAEAYYLAVGAEESLAMMQEALKLVSESMEEVNQLNKAGFVDALAVNRLELNLTEIETQVLQSERQVLLTKALLAFQIGLPMTDKLELENDLSDLMSDLKTGLEQVSQSFDPTTMPGIQEQQMYLDLAGLDIVNEQAKGWPQIGAFYTNQGNAQRDAFNFFQTDQRWYPIQLWGLNVSMPLWTSFGGRQLVEKKRIQEERARIGLEQMTQAAWMEFENAKANLSHATAVYNNAERGESIARKIYDQSQIGFSEGLVSSFEWTEARNGLLKAQGNRLAASIDWLNAKVALQAAQSDFEL